MLTTLVAVVGSMEALRTHYSDLFAGPEVTIRLAEGKYLPDSTGESLHYLESQPVEVQLEAFNGSSQTKCNLKVQSLKILNSAGTEEKSWETSTPVLPSIDMGKTASFTVHGAAPKAGLYRLRIDAKGEGGLFRSSEIPVEFPFRIWKAIGVSEPRFDVLDPRHGQVTYKIAIGGDYPSGLHGELLLFREKSIHFGTVQFPMEGRSRVMENLAPGSEVLKLFWDTPKLSAFSERMLVVSIDSEVDRQPADWNQVAKNLQPVTLLPRKHGN